MAAFPRPSKLGDWVYNVGRRRSRRDRPTLALGGWVRRLRDADAPWIWRFGMEK